MRALWISALIAVAVAVALRQHKQHPEIIIPAFEPMPENLEQVFGWVKVEYNWDGAPWANASAAIASGAFVVANNVITGLGVYRDTYFVCIPRWRQGVPSTLNVVEPDPVNGGHRLRPWPSWWHNLNVFKYVQSVYIDTSRGLIYVIDAGRENFFSANMSAHTNGPASLHVYLIETAERVYYHEFSDDIFPYNTSFLNDIVVDERNAIAYMSDTNTAGHGAVVMHDLKTNRSVRYAGKSTLADPSYIVDILGVKYPAINNPADGIAISTNGERLFYSAVEGDHLFALDATVFRDPNSTHDDIHKTVQTVAIKPSNSDGLRVLPTEDDNDVVVFGDIGHCAITAARIPHNHTAADPPVMPKDMSTIWQSNTSMQWLDSFALVPRSHRRSDLYFTTNRLQRYFARNLALNGTEGHNFRLFRYQWSW